MPPKRKSKPSKKTPHKNDPDGEHPGRGPKPMLKGDVAAYLRNLVPDWQSEVSGKPKGTSSAWYTNVAKDVMKVYGWAAFVPKLSKLGVKLQLKAGAYIRNEQLLWPKIIRKKSKTFKDRLPYR